MTRGSLGCWTERCTPVKGTACSPRKHGMPNMRHMLWGALETRGVQGSRSPALQSRWEVGIASFDDFLN